MNINTLKENKNLFDKNNSFLIIDDSTKLGEEISKNLKRRNINTVVLNWPKKMNFKNNKALDRIDYNSILDFNDHYFENKFKLLIEKEKISGIITINNKIEKVDDIDGIISDTELIKIKTMYLILYNFSLYNKAINPMILSVIRLNGKFGIGEKKCFSSIMSSIAFDMLKKFKNWKNINVKAIDIHKSIDDSRTANIIKKELFSNEKSNVFIGINENMKRYKIELAKLKKYENKTKLICNPNHRSVYIVSGGVFGNSFELIKKLAVTCKCNFIVFGEIEQIDREPKWAKDLIEPSQLKFNALNYYKSKYISINLEEINKKVEEILLSRKIQENMKLIKSYGSSIIYKNTDIINPYHIKDIVKYGERRIGKINGIIHICNNFDEEKPYKNIKTKLQEEFDKKITGLKNILKSIDKKFLESIYIVNFENADLEDFISTDGIFEKIAFSASACLPKLSIVSITCNLNEEIYKENTETMLNKNDVYRYEFLDMIFEIIKGSYGNYKNYIIKN
jgi:hypothetical protein